jgi:hypothetical protein
LEEDCELRLIYLDLLSTGVHQLLAHKVAFWILMGRSFLLRDRELASSDIFLGRVGVLSGGMEVVECLSKNEIRFRPLLGGVSFVFVHRYSAYIRTPFILWFLFYRSLSVLYRYLILIHLPFKKEANNALPPTSQ